MVPPLYLGEKEAHNTVNDLINVNARSMVKVTPLILKYGGMIAKNKGLIINISSISARLPVAYAILYGAVKQFNQYISDGLRYELRHGKNKTDNIEIQTILPSFINTKLVDGLGLGQSLFVPNVDKFVRHAVSTIGYQEITNGYWPHALLDWVVSWNSHLFSKRGAVRSEKMLRESLAEQGKRD